MSELSRRDLIAGAAATVAVAVMPATVLAAVEPPLDSYDWMLQQIAREARRPFPPAPWVDRQTFCDGECHWTFYKARLEWVGIRYATLTDADFADMEKPLPPSPDDYSLADLDDDGILTRPKAEE